MGARRCCCDCWSISDDFNRQNNTNLGINWIEYSGDWSINSQKLREAGSSHAIAIYRTHHPRITATCWASVDIIDIKPNVTYLLIVHFKSTSNYDYASYKWTVTGTGSGSSAGTDSVVTIGVGQVRGGVDTNLNSVDISDNPPESGNDTLTICCNNSGIEAVAESAAAVAWSCNTGTWNQGRRAGVGISAAGVETATWLDNFEFGEHHETDPTCPQCLCDCDDNCIPKTLILGFTASGDCADCLDGLEFESQLLSEVDRSYYWGMHLPVADPCNGDYGLTEWYLDCQLAGDTKCENWYLRNANYYQNESGCWESVNDTMLPSQCECSPMSLTYGPCEIWRPDYGGEVLVCTYTVTITPKPYS